MQKIKFGIIISIILAGSFLGYSKIASANTIMLSPNGGEIWERGETYNITWRTDVITTPTIDILLYKGDNCSLSSITGQNICGFHVDLHPTPPTALAVEIPNNGHYAWTVPALTSGNDYRMAIQNPNYLPFVLQGDAAFSISKFKECTSNTCDVYRFWSNEKQGHFFTQNPTEADGVVDNDSSWSYEGIAYSTFSSSTIGATPIYRFWSESKQHHFFTASQSEKEFIEANDSSWAYEGIAYYAYATSQANSTPVYRFWSNEKQGHFFTTSASEKENIEANDHSWDYEGIAWYVPTS